MTLDAAKLYIDKKVFYLGEIHTIKNVTQCGYGSNVIVAHLENGFVGNILIMKNPDTGKFLGDS